MYFHLVSASCNLCTAELRPREGEAAKGANHLYCSAHVVTRNMLIGEERRVAEKLTLYFVASHFTVKLQARWRIKTYKCNHTWPQFVLRRKEV